MILKEKDLNVLSHFRNNARESLTKLSRLTRIPVSTIFDKLKEYEKKQIITKHTTLLNFKTLGYDIRTQILITIDQETKNKLQEFLVKNTKINSVFRINNGFDFLIEGIFKDMGELDRFTKELDTYNPKEKKEFFIMEDIKRESFMTHKENIGVQR
ncbi:Lrp/AsnC family transcriptional regulator [Candidatus Woesearchaeota archaeon]|nr:Lrp/AsnC family transcriptional regulator [Candidatus Woesearchaeota archaeon]MCF8013578.1 Lrp/AsnC family transcriptional regulator [Candidatus Woesearchaeota archaeon]